MIILREMEANVSGLSQPDGPFNLGNSSYVNQEVAPAKSSFRSVI
jgi:hypothetical protein